MLSEVSRAATYSPFSATGTHRVRVAKLELFHDLEKTNSVGWFQAFTTKDVFASFLSLKLLNELSA